ncbi:GNAT family N-acetyltransferase [Wukongibacter baidiensis]|uniref:GNAT family N-acetyltransferase n=1 Tax=Wukongibacter baidiensis TaxID=1723361 RepID=UPI003D7F3F27
MKGEIRLANIDDKDEVVELLNKVALHLERKGIKQWSYPWDSEEIAEEISKGFIYILIVNSFIVGTFSIKDTNYVNVPLIEAENNYLYRVAVLPEYFRRNLGIKMVNYAMELSREKSKYLYLDCWAGNNKLREFYASAGLELVGDVPEEDYMVSVFKYLFF